MLKSLLFLPLAHVFRYEGDTRWVSTGPLDTTPNVRYRRAWTMALYQGRLFCGTLPSGHVLAYEAGKSVSHDHALAPGWRHVAAVRAAGVLTLYVDGRRVVASPSPAPAGYDIANGQPLFLFGDNLLVELDVSPANLPTGTRLQVGTALCEVTPKPHTGCGKFAARFGQDARDLRGPCFRAVVPGAASRSPRSDRATTERMP